jgi:hypothetical protein
MDKLDGTQEMVEPIEYTPDRKPQVFSCRVECLRDIVAFFTVACNSGIYFENIVIKDVALEARSINGIKKQPMRIPDKDCEFTSWGTLEELREVCGLIVDTHVLIETLRPCPLSENSLERDRSIN